MYIFCFIYLESNFEEFIESILEFGNCLLIKEKFLVYNRGEFFYKIRNSVYIYNIKKFRIK